MKTDWQPLFYTCDDGGNFVRLGGKYGRLFPYNEQEHIFDVKLSDGTIYEKCFVTSLDHGATITAIMQDETVLSLKTGTQLRLNPDKQLETRLRRVRHLIVQKQNTEERIKRLRQERAELAQRLADVESQLNKLT